MVSDNPRGIPPENKGRESGNFLTVGNGEFCIKTALPTESLIIAILKQAEGRAHTPDLYRDYGMSTTSFYKSETVHFG